MPAGREALWRDFAGWFGGCARRSRDVDAHQAFEGDPRRDGGVGAGLLSREAYLALGVRQSIFAPERRDALYDLFDKYRAWLAESKLFDLNLVAQDWLARARPRYDFVVIDEMQDLTPVQLALVLQDAEEAGPVPALRRLEPDRAPELLLLGAGQEPVLAGCGHRRTTELGMCWHRQLPGNGRRGTGWPTVAEDQAPPFRLDRPREQLPGRRPSAADRIGAAAGRQGRRQEGAEPADPAIDPVRRAGDARRGQGQARQHFSTPLLFSIHEAKGLEYENIVLYRFVSDHRAEFGEIVEGVRRGPRGRQPRIPPRRDKSDKSLEVYKFFVNALYVALTRAIRNLYLIRSDLRHPLFNLLEIRGSQVNSCQAVLAGGLAEEAAPARTAGQAGARPRDPGDILKRPAALAVFDQAHTGDLLRKVFMNRGRATSTEAAAARDRGLPQPAPELANCLNTVMKFQPAQAPASLRPVLRRGSPGRGSCWYRAISGLKGLMRKATQLIRADIKGDTASVRAIRSGTGCR